MQAQFRAIFRQRRRLLRKLFEGRSQCIVIAVGVWRDCQGFLKENDSVGSRSADSDRRARALGRTGRGQFSAQSTGWRPSRWMNEWWQSGRGCDAAKPARPRRAAIQSEDGGCHAELIFPSEKAVRVNPRIDQENRREHDAHFLHQQCENEGNHRQCPPKRGSLASVSRLLEGEKTGDAQATLRVAISCCSAATKSAKGRGPRSPLLRWRTLTVPASASFGPTTSM